MALPVAIVVKLELTLHYGGGCSLLLRKTGSAVQARESTGHTELRGAERWVAEVGRETDSVSVVSERYCMSVPITSTLVSGKRTLPVAVPLAGTGGCDIE